MTLKSHPQPLACYVHFYSTDPTLTAYELPSPNATKAIILIGGYTDGPHTLGLVQTTAAHLATTLPEWSVFEIRMSSSYSGCGHGSLDQDIKEISKLVRYLRGIGKQKIVIIGHSTGSQDCIHYHLNAQSSNPVDGFVMQGPVSDREWLAMMIPSDQLAQRKKIAADMIADGKAQEMMPRETGWLSFLPPATAYRYNSMASKGGDDDYFSSDLSDETLKGTFGKLSKPTLILHSDDDETVDPKLDKVALIKKWASFAPQGTVNELSGTIPGASHAVKQPESRVWFAETVEKFLKTV
ncbi:putative dolichol-phosphate mannosyltransferase [Phaeomoniella chlamydospora]|uniref:Putative dolichol-phosphate mannosyltransferase n=1 Tax=Phaeomoniella chlamydospora TaxID=158046 RepID=A0A0G2ELC0_PHACM|nr:putative dolichol-phosphate mannosyltransferase [Phaeomoniella chlamydospora]